MTYSANSGTKNVVFNNQNNSVSQNGSGTQITNQNNNVYSQNTSSQYNSFIGTRRNDVFANTFGDDYINGGNGFDVVDFSSRNNKIDLSTNKWQNTGDGTDMLLNIEAVRAGDGDDHIIGSYRNEELFGQSGNDSIKGGSGNDYVSGGYSTKAEFGDDILDGGVGNDSVFGHGGNDVIAGGKGRDLLYGGKGGDLFVVSKEFGTGRKNMDIIQDFETGTDMIVIDGNAQGLTLQASGKDELILMGRDVLAVVKGEAGQLDWSQTNDGTWWVG